MPRRDYGDYGGHSTGGGGGGGFRASLMPGGALANALSFHHHHRADGGRVRRANSRKRDSFTAVTTDADAASSSSGHGDAESSWHSVDSASSSGGSSSSDSLLAVPELLLTGAQFEKRAGLHILHKKGDRFESSWDPVFVGVYAHTLFHYDTLAALPKAVVPLAGATVVAVDRLYRSSDGGESDSALSSSRFMRPRAEECGPCWKLTSSAGRVLLFRAPTHEARLEWMDHLSRAATAAVAPYGPAAAAPLGARRRLSRATTPTADSPISSQLWFGGDELRNNSRRRQSSATADVDEVVRDAVQIVGQQKREIEQLKAQLEALKAQKPAVVVEKEPVKTDKQVDEVDKPLPQPKPTLSSSTSSSSSTTSATGTEPLSMDDLAHDGDTSRPAVDAVEVAPAPAVFDPSSTKALEQQAAALAEMVRNLNREEHTPASTAKTTDDAAVTPMLSFDESSNDFLQQQAIELAEIAKSLQSTYVSDRQNTASGDTDSAPSSTSTLLGADSMGQINSNDSDESIFSIATDDLDYLDGDGEIERLSEFEASDNLFLEASGFLDSIQQVMKDFIVTTDARPSAEQVVINDDVFAEIRQNIDSTDSHLQPHTSSSEDEEGDEAGGLFSSRRLRGFRSKSSGDYSATESRLFGAFSRVQSARDFLADAEEMHQPSVTPRDLGSLIVEDTMTVVQAVLQTAGRDEKMMLLNPLLRVFGSQNRLGHLIAWAIDMEVGSVLNVATLFRSDDYASRLVSTYSKAVGLDFIRVALSEPIQEILNLSIADVELSPIKDEALHDEVQASSNADNLMRVCQRVINSIMSHADEIPSSYFHICSHLNSKVIRRFDGSNDGLAAEDATTLTRTVIGGFLFLRFVCPAITTPHLYGLIDEPAPPETRRILVLVTKLLFKTATSVQFNDREAQFKVLNPFIEKNSAAIQQLFAQLAVVPDVDINTCFAADSRGIFSDVGTSQLEDDVAMIRTVASRNMDKIEPQLASSGCSSRTADHFRSAVLSGESSHKHARAAKKLMMNMRFLSGFGKKARKPTEVQC